MNNNINDLEYEVIPLGKANDLRGKRFGMLTVLERVSIIPKKRISLTYWSIKCDCGKIKITDGEHLKSGRTKSCGCSKPFNRTGKSHPRYNRDLTDEHREQRDMQNYEIGKWRDEVYKRDDYTCCICRERGIRLNAHHLDGWNWSKGKRFDVKNGVTLCVGCHKGFHKEYGYGHNTKAEFEEHYDNLTKNTL